MNQTTSTLNPLNADRLSKMERLSKISKASVSQSKNTTFRSGFENDTKRTSYKGNPLEKNRKVSE